MNSRPDDAHWMRHALAWSQKGRGWTSPRPSVGCVIVCDGLVLGGGHTSPGDGQPHAEVNALRQAIAAGHDTQGATAYVTLEPCSHFATTPPCTQALIEARVARVVCGVRDPNPAVDGRGYQQLRDAGIEVMEGVLERECHRAQDDFLFSIAHKTPFVTLKSAVSLDGKLATQSGESKWITGSLARQHAHRLRHEHDAVLVGIETVLADDPLLDARLDGHWKQPLRVVLDSRGRMPLDARMVQHQRAQSDNGRLIIATTKQGAPRLAPLEEAGTEVLVVAADASGRVNLDALCTGLYERHVRSILVEGGAKVAASFLDAKRVQRVAVFVAPLFIAGGREAFPLSPIARLADAPRLKDPRITPCGDDVLIEGYLSNEPEA